MPAFLHSNEAVLLSHALAGHIGRSHSVRVLSIKGPVADFYGLRDGHLAADADVLVEPSGFEHFCQALEARGWHRRVGRETPSLIAPHARTYIHDDWPCDFDVHRWYSGFFAEPDLVFNLLWRHKCTMQIANRDIEVPSRAGSAVIAALHSARHTRSPRHEREGVRIERLLAAGFGECERKEFIDLVVQGEAAAALGDLLERSHVEVIGADIDPDRARSWELNRRFAEDSSALGWLHAVRAAPVHRKPAVLLRAVWVPRVDIPRNSQLATPTHGEAWRYRAARFRRGLRSLMHYVLSRGQH